MKYRQFIIGVLIGISLGVLCSFAFVLITRPKLNSDIPDVAKTTPDVTEPTEYVFVAVTLGDKTDEMKQLLSSNNISTKVNGEGFGNWFSVPSHSRSEAIELLTKHGYKRFVDDAMSWNISAE